MDKYEEAPKIESCEKKYLIVSNGLYFRPDCRGYTGIKDEAGRYTKEFAEGYIEATAIHEDNALEFMPTTYGDLVQKHIAKIKLERDEALEKARKFDQLVERIEKAKWKGECCPNPNKGWIINSHGNRLTRLGNRNAFGKIITAHNNELDLLAANLTREDTK